MVDAYETGRPDRAHLLKFNIEKIEQGYRSRWPMAVWVACAALLCPGAKAAAAVGSVRVVFSQPPSPVMENIARVFMRQLSKRCEAKVVTSGQAPVTVELVISPGNSAEGFEISDGPNDSIRIVAQDERGLLYGVGKLLRTSRYDNKGFTPGMWRGRSFPTKPLRGIYFATHFHNFYHDAPVEEVQRYVEELGLWGYNTLVVWYDMHHFDGFDDPEALRFRERLHAICEAARRVGMDVGFGVIANEGYNNSPVGLRADRKGQRGGWYDCQVCPSKPDGMEYILGVLGQEFGWCADLHPKYVWIWPYDQGGCGCPQCRPWGANGFLKVADPLAALARRKLPGVKVVVSTWFFDAEEWQTLSQTFATKPPWADYVLAEGATRKMPGGLPMVGFPEISMHEMWPWGGFGATPLPAHFQQQWNAVKEHVSGGFPYSEGIYEDINKVLFSQFYWGDRPATETLKEYVAFEYSPNVVDEVLSVMETLERNHHMRWWPGELEGVKLDLDWFPSRGVKPRPDPSAETAYATVQRVDAKLTPQARRAWRWRQLYLRALLDAELKTNGGSPNDRCKRAFAELIEIYHAQKANPTLRPPLDQPSTAAGA